MSDDYTALLDGTTMTADTEVARRVVIALDGADKCGKTYFALTAPKPLLFLDFDMGTEGVKGIDHPLVLKSDPFSFRSTEVTFDEDDERKRQEAVQKAAQPVYQRFYETYHSALTRPALETPDGRAIKLRTLVIDTGSEAWELMRQVEFGRLTKVMPHHYSQVNAKMRDMVRAALESDVNVIWLHQLDCQWKENLEGKARKTNILERVGFKRMANLVQANLLVYRDVEGGREIKWKWGEEDPYIFDTDGRDEGKDLGFRLRFGNCRQDPTLVGMELRNDMVDFKAVAQMLQPDSSEDDWEDQA